MASYGYGYGYDDEDFEGSHPTPTVTQSDESGVVEAEVKEEVEEEEGEKDLEHFSHDLQQPPPVKLRLRWTPQLHASFVDAINQLGGLHKASPKKIHKAMGVEAGITLYHLKSHLQKYKLEKCGVGECRKGPAETLIKETSSASQDLEGRRTSSTTSLYWPLRRPRSKKHSCEPTKEAQNRKEVEEKLSLQIEAEKRLQLRQDAQKRYMNFAIENAYEKLVDQILGGVTSEEAGEYRKHVAAGLGTMLSITSPQKDLYPAYHTTEATGMQLSLEDQLGRCEAQREANSVTERHLISPGSSDISSVEDYHTRAAYLLLDSIETGTSRLRS